MPPTDPDNEVESQMFDAIDQFTAEMAKPPPEIQPGSDFLGDIEVDPVHNPAMLARLAMVAGVDQLHAVKTLLKRQDAHIFADFSLLRGSIESLSNAYWMIFPDDQSERFRRCLSLSRKDVKDAAKFSGHIHESNDDSTPDYDQTKAEIDALAASLGIVITDPVTTELLKVVGQESEIDQELASIPKDFGGGMTEALLGHWKMASGFAHGRRWAALTLSDISWDEPGNPTFRMTGNRNMVLTFMVPALRLGALAISEYQRRCGN